MRHNWRVATCLAAILMMVATVSPVLAADTGQTQDEYFVRAVAVEGLQHVPEKTVLDQVTHTKVDTKFSPDNVREDMKSIMSTGLFKDVEARYVPYTDGVKVIFAPIEQMLVKSIKIETEVLDEETLRGYFRQKEGEVLNDQELREDLDALQSSVIDDHGFVVYPSDVSISPEGDLSIVISPTRIGEIKINGNERTHDIVITREITLKPGDYLNMKRLGIDLQHLWQLGLFDEIEPKFTDGKNPGEIIVTINLVERKTGSFAFGGGYSTADGLLGYLEYSDESFLGRGERISARTEFGQKKVSYDLSFNEPYLLGTKTSMGLSLYNRTSQRSKLESGDESSDYVDRRQGGDISIGRPLGEFTRGSIALKVEDTTIEPKEGVTSVEPSQSKTRSITLSSNTDTTDNPYYPLSGTRLLLSAESAGLYLGGDTQFAKYVGRFSRYYKVGRNDQVFAFQMVGGYAPGTLPMQEEFRVGGADTLRGYSYGELRGNRMGYLNTEYRFKLNKQFQAALFVDGGQAWNSENGAPEPMKWGYGAGLRIETPLGIMRLDYGIGEDGGRTYFSLGPSF